jgi:hypothetical protein
MDLLQYDIFKERDGPTGYGLKTAQRTTMPIHPASGLAKQIGDLAGG